MLEKVKDYDDNLKLFFEKALMSIDYLSNIPQEALTELIFSFSS